MVEVKLRYVTSRAKKGGRLLWYWQRKGFPLTRLPDNERARVAKALKLNEQADTQKKGGGADFGTFGWLVPRYRDSEAFKKKAANTRDAYESWMKRYEVDWCDFPVTDADFTFISDFMKGLADQGKTTQLPLAVLSNLMKQAKYERLLEINPCKDILSVKAKRRDQVWSPDQIARLLDACTKTGGGERFALAVKLMLYTGQRPGDVRAMTWAHWKVDGILVRQQKVGTYLQVWCHSELRNALTVAKKNSIGLTIVTDDKGRPLRESKFYDWFYAACEAAGIVDRQARDFRRTAVVKLAEAGCTVPQIASVTGHSYAGVEKILEVYLPRTPELTKSAILKMERADNRKSKRLDRAAVKAEQNRDDDDHNG